MTIHKLSHLYRIISTDSDPSEWTRQLDQGHVDNSRLTAKPPRRRRVETPPTARPAVATRRGNFAADPLQMARRSTIGSIRDCSWPILRARLATWSERKPHQ